MKFQQYTKKKLIFIILFIFVFLGISILIKSSSYGTYYKKIDLVEKDNIETSKYNWIYLEFSIKDVFGNKYTKYDNLFTLYYNNTQILKDKDLNVIMDRFVKVSNEASELSESNKSDFNENKEDQSVSENINQKGDTLDKNSTIYISTKYNLENSKLLFRIFVPKSIIEENSSFMIATNIKNLSILDLKKEYLSLVKDSSLSDTKVDDDIIENNLKLVQYYIQELHMSYKNIFLSKLYWDKLMDYIIENKKDISIVFDRLDLLKLRENLNTKLEDIIGELDFEILRQMHLDNYKESIRIYEELLSFYKRIYSVESIFIQENLDYIRNST